MRSENVEFAVMLSMFRNICLMAEALYCAMSGLSWGYIEKIWGLLRSTLGASFAMLGQSWENLEATWFNLGWHSVCEMKNVHAALVLSMSLKVYWLIHLTCECCCFLEMSIFRWF